jgi:tRNA (guanine-N7-)-methyltransferase
MFANSRPVDSRQDGVHGRLDAIVRRHLEHPFRRPVGERAREQFAVLAAALGQDTRPRVLDAGCGTGVSTLRLAQRHADALVIGVDKSAHRLQTGQRALGAAGAPRNALLLRCDVVDFWLLAAAAGWRFEAQYLLYPNPWPKPEHVQRRWPGHPVLPALLACGGKLELRTNWKTYADEWCLALQLAKVHWHMDCLNDPEPISPFESKYRASAHVLWRVQADSAPGSATG